MELYFLKNFFLLVSILRFSTLENPGICLFHQTGRNWHRNLFLMDTEKCSTIISQKGWPLKREPYDTLTLHSTLIHRNIQPWCLFPWHLPEQLTFPLKMFPCFLYCTQHECDPGKQTTACGWYRALGAVEQFWQTKKQFCNSVSLQWHISRESLGEHVHHLHWTFFVDCTAYLGFPFLCPLLVIRFSTVRGPHKMSGLTPEGISGIMLLSHAKNLLLTSFSPSRWSSGPLCGWLL